MIELKKRIDEQNVEQEKKDEKLPGNSKESLDRRLDESGKESFPASDPVAVKITK